MKWRMSLKSTTDIRPESTGEMNQDPTETINMFKIVMGHMSSCFVFINHARTHDKILGIPQW
jgi:hypothetical protein